MSRQVCASCTRPPGFCFCHLLQPFDSAWQVHILQHYEEHKHPFNTARIAKLSLQNSLLQLVPDDLVEADVLSFLKQDAIEPILIYPSKDALPLSEAPPPKGTPLLFIDASWRKSRRILLQSPALQNLQCRSVQVLAPARYQIRKEPSEDYRSTLEAIVETLSILGEDKAQQMLDVMDWMIERQVLTTATNRKQKE